MTINPAPTPAKSCTGRYDSTRRYDSRAVLNGMNSRFSLQEQDEKTMYNTLNRVLAAEDACLLFKA
jgi:hypothetical protein